MICTQPRPETQVNATENAGHSQKYKASDHWSEALYFCEWPVVDRRSLLLLSLTLF